MHLQTIGTIVPYLYVKQVYSKVGFVKNIRTKRLSIQLKGSLLQAIKRALKAFKGFIGTSDNYLFLLFRSGQAVKCCNEKAPLLFCVATITRKER